MQRFRVFEREQGHAGIYGATDSLNERAGRGTGRATDTKQYSAGYDKMRNMIMTAVVVGLFLCTPLEVVAGAIFVINADGTVSFQIGTGNGGIDGERVSNNEEIYLEELNTPSTEWYEVNDPNTFFRIVTRVNNTRYGQAAEVLMGMFPGRYRLRNSTGKRIRLGPSFRTIHIGPAFPPTPACVVDARDLSLPLGTVPKWAFTGVGSIGGTPQSAEISITCTRAASATARIDGAHDPDQGAAVLSTTGPRIGVGVKLTMDGQPVTLGTEVNLGSLGVGPNMKTVTAVYVQTRDRVDGGAANATATYTVTLN